MLLTNQIVVAYCLCHLCCSPKYQGITASGRKPIQGTTIAAPRNIPFGTRVRVGGNEYIVQDRLSRKYEGRWDIYFKKHEDAKRFGKQVLNVEILK